MTQVRTYSLYPDPGISNHDDFLVTWDSLGRPVSFVNQNPGGVNEDYYFRYDSLGRLADFIPAMVGSINAVNW